MGDSLYARRFSARAGASSAALPALGETLHVSLSDGREWTLPFAGYVELALLLRNPDQREPLRVPFELASGIQRANGDWIEPGELARAFKAGDLPSAETLVIETLSPMGSPSDRWDNALRVPVDDIESATLDLPSGGRVAGYVVLGVVVGVVLIVYLIVHAMAETTRECASVANRQSALVASGAQLTASPFDRERACWVGELLAVADPWLEPAMSAHDAVSVDGTTEEVRIGEGVHTKAAPEPALR